MKIHFIAIGGAVMHNLAIALQNNGYEVTGSDDDIFEPSYSRLKEKGLLPVAKGWFPEKINSTLDAVILGMHAHPDNPEWKKAKELNLPVFSFPEYVYEHSKNKLRIAVCGSHGKTTITSMIMHVMRSCKKDFDYLVGAQLAGFETMVRLSDAPCIVIEGDEYFASPADRRPKFLLYHPQIILISGIAWDHYNVFHTKEEYAAQFKMLLEDADDKSKIIYDEEDDQLAALIQNSTIKGELIPYSAPAYSSENEKTKIASAGRVFSFSIFGKHNMKNMEGAKRICNLLDISDADFYEAMQDFKGAARRLEVMKKTADHFIFRDFAHAPSKVKASIDAVKEQYPEKKLVACLELHTYSSLNSEFLPQYAGTMQNADVRIVYFNSHTLALKQLPDLPSDALKKYFRDKKLIALNNSEDLLQLLQSLNTVNSNLLLMSSGNFDNLNFGVLT